MPSPKSMLVVDDSEAERQIVALTLGQAFPESGVRLASHPSMAKEMCEQDSFDCVILDYNMPQEDGVSLARSLRTTSTYLPIILMTSVGDEMLAAEALRSGISDYIPKSRITIESIRRTVDRSIHVCSQARLIDEQRGELENFAYALAHDFKQPIRQISTFTQMISEEIPEDRHEGLQQHLTFLGDAARRLGKLVDVMSQYTLLNQPPELSDVDLIKVLASVRGSLGPYIEERGAELVTPERAPLVRGNETLTTQVLQNLIMNGFVYNNSRWPHVEVSMRRRSDHCDIAVKDNGLGIEPQYVAEIFKPLVRLHTASEYPGSGLGLTLARKAVLAQKGSIWCESKPGQGSTFHVSLPLARGRAEPKARAEAA
jgi:light-regulated signal transduction histidine kinase (bacteriophytochrome)